MKDRLYSFWMDYNIYIIFGVLLIISGLASPEFFTPANINNILVRSTPLGLLAIGMTFVILTGDIDLSVGSLVGLSSIAFATLVHGNFFTYMPEISPSTHLSMELSPVLPIPFNFILILAFGVIIGLFTGFSTAKLKIPAFIMTLVVLRFARGLSLSYTGGRPLYRVPGYVSYMANGKLGPVPMPVIVWGGVIIISYIVLAFTSFGRNIYAVGQSSTNAWLSGINPAVQKISVFMISGLCAALAGIWMSGRMFAGDGRIAQGYELDAIAAVVIGGTSLFGGKGSIMGTVIGVLILGIIGNILNLMEVPSHPQQVAKGIIIISALSFQHLTEERS